MNAPVAFRRRAAVPRRIHCGYAGRDGRCDFHCFRNRRMAIHSELEHNCQHCGQSYFSLPDHLAAGCAMHGRGHRRLIPRNPVSIHPYREARFALQGSLLIYTAPIAEENECQIGEAFEALYWPTRALIQEAVVALRGAKVSFRLIVDMIEVRYNHRHEDDVIGSPFFSISHMAFFDSLLLNSCNFIISSINLYLRNGSMWQIERIKELQVHLAQYSPIRGRGYVEMPPELARRQGLISVRTDTNCFLYCLLCGIYGDEILMAGQVKRKKKGFKDARLRDVIKAVLENPIYYEDFLDRINLDFLGPPNGGGGGGGVGLEEIPLIEENLPTISVSVYGHSGKDTELLRAPQQVRQNHVNLLLIKHKTKELYHWICIRDYASFQGKMHRRRHEFCPRCQHRFDLRYDSLANHKCGQNSTQIRPPNQKWVKFHRFDALLFAPFVLYFKFFYLRIVNHPEGNNDSFVRAGRVVEERVPYAYTIIAVERGGKTERFTHQGEDCVKHFFTTLLSVGKSRIQKVRRTNNFTLPDSETLRKHQEADTCEVCGRSFSSELDSLKCYHHDHWSSGPLQISCSSCNLQIKPRNCIAALTLCSESRNEFKQLIQKYHPPDVTVKPMKRKNGEYVGLTIGGNYGRGEFTLNYNINMMDIGNFRADAKLEEMMEDMQGSERGFKLFREMFGATAQPLDYVVRDPTFYPSFSSVKEFEEKSNLPFQPNAAAAGLDEQASSGGGIKLLTPNMSYQDFIRHNCNGETAILGDIFEEIRGALFQEYKLDPSSFWSISSFSQQAGFLWEKCKLEPVTCPKIAAGIKKGIFGGVVQTTKLESIANSEGNENYNASALPKEICYFDMSMSYSSPLLGKLPHDQIQIMSEEELTNIDITNLDLNGDWGYIFCVDLDYESDKVKETYGEFIFPPERRTITLDAISNLQKDGLREAGRRFAECERVLLTAYKKEEAVLYYKFLVWILKHGGVVTKRHYGIKFQMKKLFASFAAHNVKTRYSSPCQLIRKLKKSMNNNFVGKLQTLSSDYPNVKFVSTAEEAVEIVSRDTFVDFDIIDSESVIMESKKQSARDQNLRLIALAVLSDSKERLYELYWDHLKRKFGSHLSHCYSHTDSLVVEITLPRRQVLQGLKELGPTVFDFSTLEDKKHFLYSEKSKGVPGLLKMEGDKFLSFYSTGSGQYSLLVDSAANEGGEGGEKGIIKAGGIPRKNAAVLRHADFKRVVCEGKLSNKIKIKRVEVTRDSVLLLETERVGLGSMNFSRFFISPSESYCFGDPRINNLISD